MSAGGVLRARELDDAATRQRPRLSAQTGDHGRLAAVAVTMDGGRSRRRATSSNTLAGPLTLLVSVGSGGVSLD